MKRTGVAIRVLITALAAVLLSGCGPNAWEKDAISRIAPDDDEALAQDYLTALRARDFATATRLLDPQFVGPGIESKMVTVADFLNRGEPLSVELVGCNVAFTAGKRRSQLTYQYRFADSWLLAGITIDTIGATKKVFGVTVNPIPRSLEELNAFTFSGKGARHYAVLFLAGAIPVFILVTLILCLRTKVRRRKWLWMIFILFGFGKLSLNWTTGQLFFNPLSVYFQLFGAAAVRYGPYAPWMISISVPLGAMVFLIRRKRLAPVGSSMVAVVPPAPEAQPALDSERSAPPDRQDVPRVGPDSSSSPWRDADGGRCS
jgi:hypothetical protein